MKRLGRQDFKEILKKLIKAWPYYIIAIAIIVLDQVSKVLVAKAAGGVTEGTVHVAWIINGFIEFAYCENTAGAMALFSFMSEEARYVIFMVITVVILVGLSIYLVFSKREKTIWVKIAVAFVYAGAIGNFIDRLIEVYVRDFIHVIINIAGREWFPYIFNVADSFLVIAVFMIIIHLLFLDKEAVFKKQPKVEEAKEDADNQGNDEEAETTKEQPEDNISESLIEEEKDGNSAGDGE